MFDVLIIFENTVMDLSEKINTKENQVQVPKQGDKCGILYDYHYDLFTREEIPMWFVGTIVSVEEASCSSEGWKIKVEYLDKTDDEVNYPNNGVQLLQKSSNFSYYSVPSAVADAKSTTCFYNENPKSLSVGDVVEALYQNGKEGGKWWSGRISAIHKGEHRADIAYFDGEFELGVPMNEGKIRLLSRGSFRTNEWLLNAFFPSIDQFQLEDEEDANDQIVKIFTKSGSDPLDFPPDEDKSDDILCNTKSATGQISEGSYLSVLCEMFSRLQQQRKSVGKVKVWPGYNVYGTAAVFIKVEGPTGVSKRHKVRILESDTDDHSVATDIEEAKNEYSVDSDLFSDSNDEVSCDEALDSPCERPANGTSKGWDVTNLCTKNEWGTPAVELLQDFSHSEAEEGVEREKNCTGWDSVKGNTVNHIGGWGISATVVTPNKSSTSSERGRGNTNLGSSIGNGWNTNLSSGTGITWGDSTVTNEQNLPRSKCRIQYRQPCRGNRALIISKYNVRSEAPLFVHTETKDDFFLRYHFGDRLHVDEISSQELLNKEKTIYGRKFILIASKFVPNDSNTCQWNSQNICGRTNGSHIKAFYLTAHQDKVSFSRDDVQSELDAIANFSELALNPGKLASRLELLVTPARKNKGANDKKMPYIFRLPLSELEEISILDNQSDGCGFIPGELLEEFLGQGSIARGAHAVQVRVYSPHMGIFKGMLVRKRGIKKIQLPSSMKKVGKSPTAKLGKNPEAIFLIKDISPSELNIDHERAINTNINNLPRQSSLKKIKEKKGFEKSDIMDILLECNVPEDLLDDYNKKASQCFNTRMHAYMFGLCDCTSGSLPTGSVFLSGFGVGAGVPTQKVVVTRAPFTEAKDLVVLPVVSQKPREMCQADWDHLCSLSFGAILFGSPSDPKATSLPGLINNGDLDGDRFCVIWQPEIVRYVEKHNSSYEEEESSDDDSYEDELIGCQLQLDSDGKSVKATVEKKLTNGKYSVKWDSGVRHMTYEEIVETRKGVECIISHKGKGKNAQVQVLWDSGEKSWEPLDHMRNQVDDIVAQYACDSGLLNEIGWKWAADYVRLKCIVQIKSHRFMRHTVEFEVWYDGDDKTEWVDKDEVDVTLLDEYVRSNDIPLKGRWEWLQKKIQKAKENWFERVQDKLADAEHMHNHDKLIKKLHYLYKAQVKDFGTREDDATSFGRAYKKSLDLGKHGGRVSLPLHLKLKVAPGNKTTFADKFIKYEECSNCL